MIVRTQPNGQLLCIYQTSHALMAAEFCRHWGNRDFARPAPYMPVMLGITQHDNGWYEWEQAPQIRPDGAPMDFMHGPAAQVKLTLWQSGVDRAAVQHPYAGLMVGMHASLLYEGDLARMADEERIATEAFLAAQADRRAQVQREFAGDAVLGPALQDQVLLDHTRLLQFGDSSSLQVCVPWGPQRRLETCPVDFQGTYTTVTMGWDEQTITYAPWPFGVDEFSVNIHGRLLDRPTFPDARAYHAALEAAPYLRLTWRVVPG